MRIIDITGPIYTGMWQYCPEYPGAVIEECPKPDFIPEDMDCFCQKFQIGGQTGTYIETAAHIRREATPVTAVDLNELFFDCVLIKLTDKAPLERIEVDEVAAAAPEIRPGDAVLVRTGWDRYWREPEFVDSSPYFARETAEWFIQQRIVLLGGDMPRFDNPAAPEFPWQQFFDSVRFVLAPVVHLDAVTEPRVKLSAFPLKVENAVSAPCRAAVFEGWPS